MKSFIPSFTAFLALSLACPAREDAPPTDTAPSPMRVTMNLVDGSRLMGTINLDTIELKTIYALMIIPLDRVDTFTVNEDQSVVVETRNGDKVSGTYTNDFQVASIIGDVTIRTDQLSDMKVMGRIDTLPKGDGPLAFGGLNWSPLRIEFEVQGDKLVSLPKVRKGYNYGHSGDGRGGMIVSNVGNKAWRDYSIEMDLCMTGVDKAFNKHGLPASHRGAGVRFHVVDIQEDWHKRGCSYYAFGINKDGGWGLTCTYDWDRRASPGYRDAKAEHTRKLTTGSGLKLDIKDGNRIRIDVVGKRIQVWFDDKKIADLVDEEMSSTHGGKTLDHGGIAIGGSWESMFWIRNFSAREL